jgi:hypothetical protein
VHNPNGKEVAKVNEKGGYQKTHGGRPMQPPSSLPRIVRSRVKEVVRALGRFLRSIDNAVRCATIPIPVMRCPCCGGAASTCRCGCGA